MPKVKCSYKPCGKRVEREDAIRNAVQSWCSSECQFAHAMALRDKARQAKEKQEKRDINRRKKERRESSIKWQIARTQEAFNEMIRLLDKDEGCIVHGHMMCGLESEWHAGHFLSRASHSHLRFDPRNCMKQCGSSNSGTEKYPGIQGSIRQRFEEGIVRRFGMEHLIWLKAYHPDKKWSKDELERMRESFKEEVRRLRSGLPPSRNWRALPIE